MNCPPHLIWITPDQDAPGYMQLNRRLIDPMENIHRCLLTISVAIANGYRAHG